MKQEAKTRTVPVEMGSRVRIAEGEFIKDQNGEWFGSVSNKEPGNDMRLRDIEMCRRDDVEVLKGSSEPRATVILFKPSGKYYTEDHWRIPAEAIGPYDMSSSPDFKRIAEGPVLVITQDPWGYPHLFLPES